MRARDLTARSTIIRESITGEEMLTLFRHQHHEDPRNPKMLKWMATQNWGIHMVDPNQLHSQMDDMIPDDPFERTIDIDEDRVRWYKARLERGEQVEPIILGPNGSIIDGNHRAQAAREAEVKLLAYVPMGESVGDADT